jgi:glycerol uptake facilitator-like aquaporin
MGYTGDLNGGSSLLKCLVAEALGTYVFAYVYLSTLFAGGDASLSAIPLISVITVVNWVGFPLSGAHLNPSVTIAYMLKNKIEVTKGAFYLLVQLGATFAAALTLYLNTVAYTGANKLEWWNSAMPRVTVWSSTQQAFAFMMEFIATFVFILIYFSANIGKGGHNVVSGFVISLGFVFCSSMISKYTKGTLNTFFYVAPRLINFQLKDIIWYILGPVLGAICGAFAYEPLLGDSVSDDETPLTDLN